MQADCLEKTGLTPRGEASTEVKTTSAAAAAAKQPAKPEEQKKAEKKEDRTGKVDLKKEGGVLGLSIVGGADTSLVRILLCFPLSGNLT